MTRWSLRRHRRRTGAAAAGAYRPDAPRPDLGPPAAMFTPSAETGPLLVPPAAGAPTAVDVASPRSTGAWPDICDQYSLQLLVLAEQLRMSLDELEADEDDPERLQRLYRVDHAVTRMRRASRDLRTLAGRGGEEFTGPVTSLLDVIRMALSAIERYTQVTIAKVAELAVLGYAADDVGELMAALLDNATRYSPGTAAVSAHLTAEGSVLLRVDDTGIGIAPETVDGLNAMLAGPVPEIDNRTGLHTGFPVVHRIARKHQIAVRLTSRPSPGSGTIAMVTLPAHLLCEIPEEPPAGARPTVTESVTTLPTASERRMRVPRASGIQTPPGARSDGLPHRERASLRASLGRDREPGSREPGGRHEPSPEERAAARRAFADDLAAFSLGSPETRGSQEPPEKGTMP